jgi:hypothetical protein
MRKQISPNCKNEKIWYVGENMKTGFYPSYGPFSQSKANMICAHLRNQGMVRWDVSFSRDPHFISALG